MIDAVLRHLSKDIIAPAPPRAAAYCMSVKCAYSLEWIGLYHTGRIFLADMADVLLIRFAFTSWLGASFSESWQRW